MILKLFDGIGIELEYMIVDKDTLKVKPICDKVMQKISGKICSDYENGNITWSNELVAHVIELKISKPSKSFQGLGEMFHENINTINSILDEFNAFMLPTGAHPTMNPLTETVLWPYENREYYDLFNEVFDCRGHGWSNLQSMHINLPFSNDEEFAKLHTAIRFLMPLMPAMTASTPILDGHFSGFMDARLEVYRHNQDKIPSIAGLVIPEAVYSKKEYDNKILKIIDRDFGQYDPKNILVHGYALNSRGAIARFDRNTIEIRILDLQEAPVVDLAIAELFFYTLKMLVEGNWIPFDTQASFITEDLAKIFLGIIKEAENYKINFKNYLEAFEIKYDSLYTAKQLWQIIFKKVSNKLSKSTKQVICKILERGTLSSRIMNSLKGDYSNESINTTYYQLANCLRKNNLFNVD